MQRAAVAVEPLGRTRSNSGPPAQRRPVSVALSEITSGVDGEWLLLASPNSSVYNGHGGWKRATGAGGSERASQGREGTRGTAGVGPEKSEGSKIRGLGEQIWRDDAR